MICHVDRNSLCCESIVRRAPNGELLLVCQEDDITEPAPLNRVYCFHSSDDGVTWTNKHLIVPEDGRAVYNTEVSVLNGKIYCFLTFHNGSFLNYECSVYESSDNGYSFTKVCDVPFFENEFVFIRGMIKLNNGDILFPYQSYVLTKEENDELVKNKKMIWESSTRESLNGVLISKDNGKTYVRSKDAIIDMDDPRWHFVWSEPTIVELSDGTITMLLRNNKKGYLYRSDSHDGGFTWEKPYQTDIPNSSNKPKLIKMDDGRIILVNTPDTRCGFKYRFPLEMWISNDDLKSFSYKKTLIDYPGWISYPDGFVEGNTLYLTYEFNRHDIYFVKETI